MMIHFVTHVVRGNYGLLLSRPGLKALRAKIDLQSAPAAFVESGLTRNLEANVTSSRRRKNSTPLGIRKTQTWTEHARTDCVLEKDATGQGCFSGTRTEVTGVVQGLEVCSTVLASKLAIVRVCFGDV